MSTNPVTSHTVLEIIYPSDVGHARRTGQTLARELGFDEERIGRLALLISEAASNILKHAGLGVIHLLVFEAGGQCGIDIVSVDKGPGIKDIAQAMQDGFSSVGTSGTGLGAMRRLADAFEIYIPHEGGLVIHMRLFNYAVNLPVIFPAADIFKEIFQQPLQLARSSPLENG
jgi:anti-sigma regulatory factor (Ser/Thr protein kinase)